MSWVSFEAVISQISWFFYVFYINYLPLYTTNSTINSAFLISLTNRFISVGQPPKLFFGPNDCFPCLDSHSSASSFCPLFVLCVFRTRRGLFTLNTCSWNPISDFPKPQYLFCRFILRFEIDVFFSREKKERQGYQDKMERLVIRY